MTMHIERAKEIVAATNSFCVARIGITPAKIEALRDVSLKMMIEAADVVSALNEATARAPADGLPRNFLMYPDHRLIAAVFTFLNYSSASDDVEGDDNMILCIGLPNGGVRFLSMGARSAAEVEEAEEDEAAA